MRVKHRGLLGKVFLLNLLIPLVLGTLREQIVGIWNPRLDMTLSELVVFSFRPMTTAAILGFSMIAYAIIVILLRPLLAYLRDGSHRMRARHAALRIPWVLLILHVGGWFLGTFVLYAFVFNWDSPGGISFFWSLMISLSTGLATGVFTALAVNTLLLDTKRALGVQEILPGERDLFIRTKGYIIMGSALYLQSVYLIHLSLFYVDARAAARAHISLPLGMALVALYGAAVAFAMLVLSRREDRYQTRMLRGRIAQLSESGGDLSRFVTLVNFDEVGEIVHAFNEFTSGLAEIVREVRAHTQELARTGDELSLQMQDTASSVALNAGNVDSIRKAIISQSDAVGTTNEAITSVAKNVASLRRVIADQAASVNQSSAAVEEMVANVATITGNLEQVVGIFKELTAASASGKEKINQAVVQARSVAHQSETLAEANHLLANIAARTNLLAMNAAIEAAHAGDAGRGFAVVADEIRKLAENSSEQSRTISNRVGESLQTIDSVVSAAGDAERAFDQVSSLIERTSELESQVMAAMDEQRTGGSEVLKALTSINEITGNVQHASSQMGEESERMALNVKQLEERTTRIREEIDAIQSRTAEIDRNIDAVTTLGKKNHENIDGVNRVVGRFKISEEPQSDPG